MGHQNDDECVTPKLIAVPEANLETDPTQAIPGEGSHSSDDSQEISKTDKSDTEAAPLIPDLLVGIFHLL